MKFYKQGLTCLIAGALWANTAAAYTISLHGGFFFGPGPIVPDIELPDGQIRNVEFDLAAYTGFAPFSNAGQTLSDGKTLINENIDAGVLVVGDNKQQNFLLVAINDGPHKGKEEYAFNDNYEMVWRVDLALDPGFEEGLIRLHDFVLSTGIVEIPKSVQTDKNIPGGYDKAGSKLSGDYLFGKVGDYDNDGFLDGVIVAAPHVPMKSNMLPGAPVGNMRGFTTDIPLKPLVATELALRSVASFKRLANKAIADNNAKQLTAVLTEARSRVLGARQNYDTSLLSGALKADKLAAHTLGWHIDGVERLAFIPWSFLTTYDYSTGNISGSIVESTGLFFDKLDELTSKVAGLNEQYQQAFKPASAQAVKQSANQAKAADNSDK